MMKIINISPTKIEDEENDHWQQDCIYLSTQENNDTRYVNHSATVTIETLLIKEW